MPRRRTISKDYICTLCFPNQTEKRDYSWNAGWRISRAINAHKRLIHNNKEIEVIIFKKDKDNNITSKVEYR